MKIYVDLVLLLNFAFDFLLLTSVSIILRRNISLNKLLLGSFLGSLSILTLFFPITNTQLFLIKITISILMTILTFGYKDLKYTLRNLFYLYSASLILGGGLYALNIQTTFHNNGLSVSTNKMNLNFIFLIMFSPIIIYSYTKQAILLKNTYSNYYKVDVHLKNNKIIHCNAFLDTGNKLKDPYQKRPIILINKKALIHDINEFEMILVPYMTVNNTGLLQCIPIHKIQIHGIGSRENVLVGIMEEKIKMDGINCILNSQVLEE